MVVVSVLPEEEDVLHSVAWCCPLPHATLQILCIRRTCFIARLTLTYDHSLVGFSVALWQHQLKMCTEVLPQCYSLLCGTGALCHLHDVISVLLVSRCSQGAPPVLVWHWSGCCGIFLLFPQSFRPASSCPCLLACCGGGWLCGGPCAGADSAALSAVQEELGRSPARSAVPFTIGERDEQVSPQKCGAEMDSVLCARSNAWESVAVGWSRVKHLHWGDG